MQSLHTGLQDIITSKNQGRQTLSPPPRNSHGRAGKLKGSISTSLAATAAAIVIGPAVGIGGGHLIGGHRHGVDPADQLRGLGIQSSGQVAVLVGLRGSQLERLILRLEGIDLALSQEVQNGAGVGVVILQDIAGAALDGVLDGAGIGRHVVIHTIDGPLGLAATILSLSGHIAHLRLDTVEALKQSHIGVVEAAGDTVVQGIGTIANALLDSRDAALHTVEGNGLVYICTGGKALESGISAGTATTEASETTAAPAKDHSQNDDAKNPAAITPHAIATVVVISLSSDISGCKIVHK